MERRHAVQAAPAGTEERLVQAVQEEAMRLKPLAHAQGSACVLGRLGGELKKLFGIG